MSGMRSSNTELSKTYLRKLALSKIQPNLEKALESNVEYLEDTCSNEKGGNSDTPKCDNRVLRSRTHHYTFAEISDEEDHDLWESASVPPIMKVTKHVRAPRAPPWPDKAKSTPAIPKVVIRKHSLMDSSDREVCHRNRHHGDGQSKRRKKGHSWPYKEKHSQYKINSYHKTKLSSSRSMCNYTVRTNACKLEPVLSDQQSLKIKIVQTQKSMNQHESEEIITPEQKSNAVKTRSSDQMGKYFAISNRYNQQNPSVVNNTEEIPEKISEHSANNLIPDEIDNSDQFQQIYLQKFICDTYKLKQSDWGNRLKCLRKLKIKYPALQMFMNKTPALKIEKIDRTGLVNSGEDFEVLSMWETLSSSLDEHKEHTVDTQEQDNSYDACKDENISIPIDPKVLSMSCALQDGQFGRTDVENVFRNLKSDSKSFNLRSGSNKYREPGVVTKAKPDWSEFTAKLKKPKVLKKRNYELNELNNSEFSSKYQSHKTKFTDVEVQDKCTVGEAESLETDEIEYSCLGNNTGDETNADGIEDETVNTASLFEAELDAELQGILDSKVFDYDDYSIEICRDSPQDTSYSDDDVLNLIPSKAYAGLKKDIETAIREEAAEKAMKAITDTVNENVVKETSPLPIHSAPFLQSEQFTLQEGDDVDWIKQDLQYSAENNGNELAVEMDKDTPGLGYCHTNEGMADESGDLCLDVKIKNEVCSIGEDYLDKKSSGLVIQNVCSLNPLYNNDFQSAAYENVYIQPEWVVERPLIDFNLLSEDTTDSTVGYVASTDGDLLNLSNKEDDDGEHFSLSFNSDSTKFNQNSIGSDTCILSEAESETSLTGSTRSTKPSFVSFYKEINGDCEKTDPTTDIIDKPCNDENNVELNSDTTNIKEKTYVQLHEQSNVDDTQAYEPKNRTLKSMREIEDMSGLLKKTNDVANERLSCKFQMIKKESTDLQIESDGNVVHHHPASKVILPSEYSVLDKYSLSNSDEKEDITDTENEHNFAGESEMLDMKRKSIATDDEMSFRCKKQRILQNKYTDTEASAEAVDPDLDIINISQGADGHLKKSEIRETYTNNNQTDNVFNEPDSDDEGCLFIATEGDGTCESCYSAEQQHRSNHDQTEIVQGNGKINKLDENKSNRLLDDVNYSNNTILNGGHAGNSACVGHNVHGNNYSGEHAGGNSSCGRTGLSSTGGQDGMEHPETIIYSGLSTESLAKCRANVPTAKFSKGWKRSKGKDPNELPIILPPKRRQRTKLASVVQQEVVDQLEAANQRISTEFPKHNWLFNKYLSASADFSSGNNQKETTLSSRERSKSVDSIGKSTKLTESYTAEMSSARLNCDLRGPPAEELNCDLRGPPAEELNCDLRGPPTEEVNCDLQGRPAGELIQDNKRMDGIVAGNSSLESSNCNNSFDGHSEPQQDTKPDSEFMEAIVGDTNSVGKRISELNNQVVKDTNRTTNSATQKSNSSHDVRPTYSTSLLEMLNRTGNCETQYSYASQKESLMASFGLQMTENIHQPNNTVNNSDSLTSPNVLDMKELSQDFFGEKEEGDDKPLPDLTAKRMIELARELLKCGSTSKHVTTANQNSSAITQTSNTTSCTSLVGFTNEKDNQRTRVSNFNYDTDHRDLSHEVQTEVSCDLETRETDESSSLFNPVNATETDIAMSTDTDYGSLEIDCLPGIATSDDLTEITASEAKFSTKMSDNNVECSHSPIMSIWDKIDYDSGIPLDEPNCTSSDNNFLNASYSSISTCGSYIPDYNAVSEDNMLSVASESGKSSSVHVDVKEEAVVAADQDSDTSSPLDLCLSKLDLISFRPRLNPPVQMVHPQVHKPSTGNEIKNNIEEAIVIMDETNIPVESSSTEHVKAVSDNCASICHSLHINEHQSVESQTAGVCQRSTTAGSKHTTTHSGASSAISSPKRSNGVNCINSAAVIDDNCKEVGNASPSLMNGCNSGRESSTINTNTMKQKSEVKHNFNNSLTSHQRITVRVPPVPALVNITTTPPCQTIASISSSTVHSFIPLAADTRAIQSLPATSVLTIPCVTSCQNPQSLGTLQTTQFQHLQPNFQQNITHIIPQQPTLQAVQPILQIAAGTPIQAGQLFITKPVESIPIIQTQYNLLGARGINKSNIVQSQRNGIFGPGCTTQNSAILIFNQSNLSNITVTPQLSSSDIPRALASTPSNVKIDSIVTEHVDVVDMNVNRTSNDVGFGKSKDVADVVVPNKVSENITDESNIIDRNINKSTKTPNEFDAKSESETIPINHLSNDVNDTKNDRDKLENSPKDSPSGSIDSDEETVRHINEYNKLLDEMQRKEEEMRIQKEQMLEKMKQAKAKALEKKKTKSAAVCKKAETCQVNTETGSEISDNCTQDDNNSTVRKHVIVVENEPDHSTLKRKSDEQVVSNMEVNKCHDRNFISAEPMCNEPVDMSHSRKTCKSPNLDRYDDEINETEYNVKRLKLHHITDLVPEEINNGNTDSKDIGKNISVSAMDLSKGSKVSLDCELNVSESIPVLQKVTLPHDPTETDCNFEDVSVTSEPFIELTDQSKTSSHDSVDIDTRFSLPSQSGENFKSFPQVKYTNSYISTGIYGSNCHSQIETELHVHENMNACSNESVNLSKYDDVLPSNLSDVKRRNTQSLQLEAESLSMITETNAPVPPPMSSPEHKGPTNDKIIDLTGPYQMNSSRHIDDKGRNSKNYQFISDPPPLIDSKTLRPIYRAPCSQSLDRQIQHNSRTNVNSSISNQGPGRPILPKPWPSQRHLSPGQMPVRTQAVSDHVMHPRSHYSASQYSHVISSQEQYRPPIQHAPPVALRQHVPQRSQHLYQELQPQVHAQDYSRNDDIIHHSQMRVQQNPSHSTVPYRGSHLIAEQDIPQLTATNLSSNVKRTHQSRLSVGHINTRQPISQPMSRYSGQYRGPLPKESHMNRVSPVPVPHHPISTEHTNTVVASFNDQGNPQYQRYVHRHPEDIEELHRIHLERKMKRTLTLADIIPAHSKVVPKKIPKGARPATAHAQQGNVRTILKQMNWSLVLIPNQIEQTCPYRNRSTPMSSSPLDIRRRKKLTTQLPHSAHSQKAFGIAGRLIVSMVKQTSKKTRLEIKNPVKQSTSQPTTPTYEGEISCAPRSTSTELPHKQEQCHPTRVYKQENQDICQPAACSNQPTAGSENTSVTPLPVRAHLPFTPQKYHSHSITMTLVSRPPAVQFSEFSYAPDQYQKHGETKTEPIELIDLTKAKTITVETKCTGLHKNVNGSDSSSVNDYEQSIGADKINEPKVAQSLIKDGTDIQNKTTEAGDGQPVNVNVHNSCEVKTNNIDHMEVETSTEEVIVDINLTENEKVVQQELTKAMSKRQKPSEITDLPVSRISTHVSTMSRFRSKTPPPYAVQSHQSLEEQRGSLHNTDTSEIPFKRRRRCYSGSFDRNASADIEIGSAIKSIRNVTPASNNDTVTDNVNALQQSHFSGIGHQHQNTTQPTQSLNLEETQSGACNSNNNLEDNTLQMGSARNLSVPQPSLSFSSSNILDKPPHDDDSPAIKKVLRASSREVKAQVKKSIMKWIREKRSPPRLLQMGQPRISSSPMGIQEHVRFAGPAEQRMGTPVQASSSGDQRPRQFSSPSNHKSVIYQSPTAPLSVSIASSSPHRSLPFPSPSELRSGRFPSPSEQRTGRFPSLSDQRLGPFPSPSDPRTGRFPSPSEQRFGRFPPSPSEPRFGQFPSPPEHRALQFPGQIDQRNVFMSDIHSFTGPNTNQSSSQQMANIAGPQMGGPGLQLSPISPVMTDAGQRDIRPGSKTQQQRSSIITGQEPYNNNMSRLQHTMGRPSIMQQQQRMMSRNTSPGAAALVAEAPGLHLMMRRNSSPVAIQQLPQSKPWATENSRPEMSGYTAGPTATNLVTFTQMQQMRQRLPKQNQQRSPRQQQLELQQQQSLRQNVPAPYPVQGVYSGPESTSQPQGVLHFGMNNFQQQQPGPSPSQQNIQQPLIGLSAPQISPQLKHLPANSFVHTPTDSNIRSCTYPQIHSRTNTQHLLTSPNLAANSGLQGQDHRYRMQTMDRYAMGQSSGYQRSVNGQSRGISGQQMYHQVPQTSSPLTILSAPSGPQLLENQTVTTQTSRDITKRYQLEQLGHQKALEKEMLPGNHGVQGQLPVYPGNVGGPPLQQKPSNTDQGQQQGCRGQQNSNMTLPTVSTPVLGVPSPLKITATSEPSPGIEGGDDSVPHLQQIHGTCVICGKFSLYLCSSCKKIWYCSLQCQLSHWQSHSTECTGGVT